MVLIALLCGFLGAVTAHIAYVQSNLFILGDVTRRSRHALWDPLAFDLMGLVWGVAVGIVAAKFFDASTVKAYAAALCLTLLGISAVGGVSTFNRYRALYSHPDLEGAGLVLEFELRLPANIDPAGVMPDIVALSEGPKHPTQGPVPRDRMHVVDGRIILPGSIPLKTIYSDRILSFPYKDNWHAIFTLLLHEVPTLREHEWTDWESERNSRDDVPASQQYQIRYRVQGVAKTSSYRSTSASSRS